MLLFCNVHNSSASDVLRVLLGLIFCPVCCLEAFKKLKTFKTHKNLKTYQT